MVDNNGFVVISEDPVHTGKFFGEVDGTILESLVKNDIFRQIKIYDYQVNKRCEGPSINDALFEVAWILWGRPLLADIIKYGLLWLSEINDIRKMFGYLCHLISLGNYFSRHLKQFQYRMAHLLVD